MGYSTNFTLQNASEITNYNESKIKDILEDFKKHLEDFNIHLVNKLSKPFLKIEKTILKNIKIAMKESDLNKVLTLKTELDTSQINLKLCLKNNHGILRDIESEVYFVQGLLQEDNVDGKWYSHEATMLELSKVINNIPLTLYGSGEEDYDKWIKVWKNGILISHKIGKITIEYVETLNIDLDS